jgi:hypothetical protein
VCEGILQCCALPCCAVPCCAPVSLKMLALLLLCAPVPLRSLPCCAVLSPALLCRTVPCPAVLCCPLPCCAVLCSCVARLLASVYLQEDYFDLVDVDSFGSDSSHLPAAINALKFGGLLYLTSTDGMSAGGRALHTSGAVAQSSSPLAYVCAIPLCHCLAYSRRGHTAMCPLASVGNPSVQLLGHAAGKGGRRGTLRQGEGDLVLWLPVHVCCVCLHRQAAAALPGSVRRLPALPPLSQ